MNLLKKSLFVEYIFFPTSLPLALPDLSRKIEGPLLAG